MYRIERIENDTFYHIFNRDNNKQRIFFDDEDYSDFIAKLKDYADRCQVEVPIYTLMPNHFHLMVRQRREGSVASMMAGLCLSTALRFNRKYQHVNHLFGGRYCRKPVDDQALWWLACYIHLNPVRAGMKKDPAEWKYSNYLDYAEKGLTYSCQTADLKVDFDKAYVAYVEGIKNDERAGADLTNQLRPAGLLYDEPAEEDSTKD